MKWFKAHKGLTIGTVTPLLLILLYNTPIVKNYSQRMMGEKLVAIARGANSQINTVTYTGVHYSLMRSQLIFDDLEVSFHPTGTDTVYNTFSAKIINLNIDGLWKIYFKKSLVIEGLSVLQPRIRVHKKLGQNETTNLSLQTGDLYNSISKMLNALAISTFDLQHGHFTFLLHNEEGISEITINDLSLWIENFQLDETSASRKDKILMTDNIKVKFANQSLYLPDSIHAIHFDSLSLSTAEDYFYVYGFNITAKKDISLESNYYDLNIPILSITNVDFSKAYNQRELNIDKILLSGGTVIVDNRKKNIGSRNPDLLIQINHVFGKLSIQELTFKDTQLSIHADPIGLPEKIELNQLDLSVYQINLDQSNTAFDFDHRYFKDLELTLNDHAIELSERNHRLEMANVHISTRKKLFSAGKINIKPILHDPAVSILNEAQIENLTLEGFDPYQLVNDRQLLLKLIKVERLGIKTTPKAGTVQKSGINPIHELEDLFPYIRPFSDQLRIDSLSIQNINLDMPTANGPFLVQGASLLINSFNLDSTTHLQPENIFQVENFIVFVPRAILPVKDQQIEIDSFYINKDLTLLTTKTIQFTKKKGSSGFGVNGSVDAVYFKGLKLRQILYQQRYLFDSLIIKHPVIDVHEVGGIAGQPKSKSNISSFIDEFEIGLISVEDGELRYQEGNLEIAHLNNLGLLVTNAALSSQDLKKDEILVKYEDFLLNFDSLYFSSPEFKHVLNVQNCQFHLKDSTGSIQNILLTPIVEQDSLSLFTLSIPAITFKGINDYSSYYNKKIDISALQIEKPSIRIQAGFRNPEKVQTGFPALTSTLFLFDWDSLGVDDFKITKGSLQFLQGAKTFTIKNFDLTLDDFEVFRDSEMIREKFLFAKEVDFKLLDILYHDRSVNDSVAVRSVHLNSKDEKMELDGIHLTLNHESPIVGSIPSIEFTGLSFFDFTQLKKVIVKDLAVKNPTVQVALNTQGSRQNGKFAQLNKYPFQTNQIASIQINHGSVQDARILGIKDSLLSIGNIGFQLNNFILHPDSIAKRNLPFHSEKFELTVSDVSYQINPMNKIQISMFDYRSKPSVATVQGLAIVPLYDRVAYAEKLGEQASWMSLTNTKTQIQNLDFEQLIGNKAIHANKIVVDDISIDVFRDKRLPFPTNQVRELPHHSLKNLPLGVKIDTVQVRSGYVQYVEQSAKIDTTGSIYFNQIQASITNITNDSAHITKNPTMTALIETRLYGSGNTVARFDFDLSDPDYGYKYTTTVGEFDLLKLNAILEPAVLARIREGTLNSLQQVVTANDDYAQGEMIFRYNNLKVGLIKSVAEPNPGLGKALASFFANTFIVRSKNPAPFIRKSDVFFERNHAKSIFDFLTKSTLSGVVESIGARSNRKKIRQHKKDEKQQARRKNKVLPSDSE